MAVVGENIQPPRSVSSRPLGDRRTPGGGAATPGPKQEEGVSSKEHEMGGLVTVLTPRILGGWMGNSPPRIPQLLGLSTVDPKNFKMLLGPGGRPKLPLAPTPCCAHSTVTHSALHPSQPLALSHPFHHCFLGSKWFPPWPHPHLSGDLITPIAHLAPKPPCFSCCSVCPPPPLCLSSRPPRSSLSPCPPCSLLHSSPTNLSWPLSPSPSSHLLLTGMSPGQ